MKSIQVKPVAAVIGVGAIAGMAALTVVVSGGEPAGDGYTRVVSDEMTTGETITETTAPAEPETTVVEPPVKAEPPDGFGPDWAG